MRAMRDFSLAESQEKVGFHCNDPYGAERWAIDELLADMVPGADNTHAPADVRAAPTLSTSEWESYVSDAVNTRMQLVTARWLTPEAPLVPEVSSDYITVLICVDCSACPRLRVVSSDLSTGAMEASELWRGDVLFVSHTSKYALCAFSARNARFSLLSLQMREGNKRACRRPD